MSPVALGLQIRDLVVGRVETPVVGILEGRDKVFRFVVVAGLCDPERRTHAAGVELLQGLAIRIVEVAQSPAVGLEVARSRDVEQIAARDDRWLNGGA